MTLLTEPTASAWRALLPNSNPDEIEAMFDALPTEPRTAIPKLKVEGDVEFFTSVELEWKAATGQNLPYEVNIEVTNEKGAISVNANACFVPEGAAKRQGFGFAVLQLGARLAINNGYEALHIPDVIGDGLLFWPRQGAVVSPDLIRQTKSLLRLRHHSAVNTAEFYTGHWQSLLRDQNTGRLLTQVLRKIGHSGQRGLAMTFDRAALEAVLAKPPLERPGSRPACVAASLRTGLHR